MEELNKMSKKSLIDVSGGKFVEFYQNGLEFLDSAKCYRSLMEDLDWQRIDQTPRQEYYSSKKGVPYTYGSGRGIRTYQSQEWTKLIGLLSDVAEDVSGVKSDVVFLNRYDDSRQHLGWHSDDSPEMDPTKPIVIISFGGQRYIDFREIGSEKKTSICLTSGSICVMPAGLQQTHEHRIPKYHDQRVAPRVSLTFRTYREVN